MHETEADAANCVCERCDGMCWLDDETACGDPDHCSPMYACPDCNPEGRY